jgi:ABC-type transport system involved in multi-copper enzyme maturation permease subunit
MKPVWLIAANFLREQRWPIVILLGWVALLSAATGFSGLRSTPDDVFMLFQQVAVYVLVFSLFFGASAIRNELRTRRILAVLSKGISRRQYIAGLLLGIVIAIVIYCLALGAAGTWTLPLVGVPAGRFWFLLLGLLAASLLTACVALFFSIFLHPLLATGATVVVVGAPLLAGALWKSAWASVIPVYAILQGFLNLSEHTTALTGWLVVLAFVETVFLWLLSAWLFSRKDVAVAVE